VPLVGRRPAPSKRTILWILSAALLLVACAAPPDTGGVTGGGHSDPNPPGFFPTDPASEQGGYIAGLYPLVFFIAAAVFLLVEGLLIVIVLRFRRRPADQGLPAQTHGNDLLEVLWTAIPALVVTALFVLTLGTLSRVEALSDEPAVQIDVKGFQFQWTFTYPTEGISLTGAGRQGPVMGLPVNEAVRIRLESQDVIHSFYVPQFLYKKDVVPGRVNEFEVIMREPGTYTGQCAEFCGLSHADMWFTVLAMERPDYDAWVAAEQEKASQTPPPAPPGAVSLQVTSVSVAEGFEPAELSAPPDAPLTVQLTNADPAAPHDFAIRGTPQGDWQGDPDAPAAGSAVYQAPPLPAGTYEFYCSIHPNMVGTLNVGR
jgi:cytochrome c oxidase subunit II